MPEMHADALHSIEAPPIGGCTMAEAYIIVGDELTLISNIQYDEFRSFTSEQIRQAVTELLGETRGKDLFSPDPTPQFINNYMTMIETAVNFK